MKEMAEAGEKVVPISSKFDVEIPESEKLELKSPYFESALYTVRKEIPEKEKEVEAVLASIDHEMVENLSVFESKKFLGVVVPYTKVSVNQVVAENFGVYPTNGLHVPKRAEVVFCGFAKTPGGHPYTAGDIVYDRVFGAIPEVVGPVRRSFKEPEPIPNVEVVSFGSPNGMGGKVTLEWVDGLKDQGFEQYAELYSEMVQSLENSEAKIMFNGMSMGATVAEKTANRLAVRKKIKVIMDNPVTNHGKLAVIYKALQIPIGFLGESALKMGFNKNVKMEVAAEEQFGVDYRKILTDKGILASDNHEQAKLKGAAVRTDAIMMIKGTDLDNDDVRAYIRRGLSDPTTISPLNVVNILNKKINYKIQEREKYLDKNVSENTGGIFRGKSRSKNVEEYAISATHFINRWRVKKWARVVDMAKKIDQPFSSTGEVNL